MRKLTICILACLLFATMAVAQATSSPSSQQPAATQSQQPAQQPSATQSGERPSGVQGTTANPQQPAQQPDQGAAQPRPADDNAPTASTQRAGNQGGGVPWGWIIVGIVVVAVILALIGRGNDRVETVERTDVRDRDIVDRDRDVIVREPRDRRVG